MEPQDVNRLQNVFARVLNDLGNDMAVRFFQDQMRWSDYGRIVNHTLAGVSADYSDNPTSAWSARKLAQWIIDYLRFSSSALGQPWGVRWARGGGLDLRRC